jgi:hypothetical protein
MAMTNNIQRELPQARPVSNPATAWLAARGLRAPESGQWRVTILLDVVDPWGEPSDVEINTRLHIMIEPSEWGVLFCRGSGSSWIRVRNAPRIQDRDDFGLLAHITELRGLGVFVQWLERRFQIQLRRSQAVIYSDLADAHHKILLWVVAAL